jgi:hypothetical protein
VKLFKCLFLKIIDGFESVFWVCQSCSRGARVVQSPRAKVSIQLHKRAEMESALGELCRGLSLPVGGVFLGDLEGGGRFHWGAVQLIIQRVFCGLMVFGFRWGGLGY